MKYVLTATYSEKYFSTHDFFTLQIAKLQLWYINSNPAKFSTFYINTMHA